MPSHKPSTPHHHHHRSKRPRLHPSKPAQSSKLSKPNPRTNSGAPPPHHLKPVIPFLPTDHILLVGEGDFSFAYSLLHHHTFKSLVATSLDSRDVVLEKYPHAGEFLRGLENWGWGDEWGGGEGWGRQKGEEGEENRSGEENGEGKGEKIGEIKGVDEKEGDEDDEEDEAEGQDKENSENRKKEVRVKFGVDATKLTRAKVLGRTKIKKKKAKNKKQGGPGPGFDKIVFNFPHVGGKTKDVNRQVRYNQDLLVHFLLASQPLLAPGGAILITLFEGLPYSLWNIRDLARHVGLRVGRSFRFDAAAYPGYRHARTGGIVKGRGGGGGEGGGGGGGEDGDEGGGGEGGGEGGGGDEEGEGEKGEEEEGEEEEEERRGWRGEERAARTYIFEVVGEDEGEGDRQEKERKRKRKRKGEGGSDSDDEDENEDENEEN